jgi:hypothetical protein
MHRTALHSDYRGLSGSCLNHVKVEEEWNIIIPIMWQGKLGTEKLSMFSGYSVSKQQVLDSNPKLIPLLFVAMQLLLFSKNDG